MAPIDVLRCADYFARALSRSRELGLPVSCTSLLESLSYSSWPKESQTSQKGLATCLRPRLTSSRISSHTDGALPGTLAQAAYTTTMVPASPGELIFECHCSFQRAVLFSMIFRFEIKLIYDFLGDLYREEHRDKLQGV